ncbi:MAG: BON domain-containing protein [Candidatus Omnitrophica bacterium]|nr:BON domain-containing protein [Candidatus Omnitrophota bacterium]MCA9429807.1 BON domain-containing protein [Candidatus Omnitrophota bacterium]MCA9440207.1 BON domain-containing protein [Candidatus Omnitrophota bacterium]MCB9769514.1 BON domain-containing protein [Candidatus Omnitrophota bacterium]MCB9783599.1 BON domain-containing protein [Candidatus Omnitrophota bacterium]
MTVRQDAKILKDVIQALDSAGLYTDCDLEVMIEEGIVQIEGTVPNRNRGEEILDVLRPVKGIQGVEFEIHVLHGEDTLSFEETFGDEDASETEARKLMEDHDELREIGENPM